jgi:2-polyprenyl-6-methoxyphenol hydroxylase-like FAD-dependent oxidoreductase
VSPTRGRAIVISASLAGLFAATLLRKAGWHTEVFERSLVELVGRGAGITTHPELLQSLVRSGVDLNDLGVVVHERVALDAGGPRRQLSSIATQASTATSLDASRTRMEVRVVACEYVVREIPCGIPPYRVNMVDVPLSVVILRK